MGTEPENDAEHDSIEDDGADGVEDALKFLRKDPLSKSPEARHASVTTRSKTPRTTTSVTTIMSSPENLTSPRRRTRSSMDVESEEAPPPKRVRTSVPQPAPTTYRSPYATATVRDGKHVQLREPDMVNSLTLLTGFVPRPTGDSAIGHKQGTATPRVAPTAKMVINAPSTKESTPAPHGSLTQPRATQSVVTAASRSSIQISTSQPTAAQHLVFPTTTAKSPVAQAAIGRLATPQTTTDKSPITQATTAKSPTPSTAPTKLATAQINVPKSSPSPAITAQKISAQQSPALQNVPKPGTPTGFTWATTGHQAIPPISTPHIDAIMAKHATPATATAAKASTPTPTPSTTQKASVPASTTSLASQTSAPVTINSLPALSASLSTPTASQPAASPIPTITTKAAEPAPSALTLGADPMADLTNLAPSPISLITNDIDTLTAEIHRDTQRAELLQKTVEITVHRLESLKVIRDDSSSSLFPSESWGKVLEAVNGFIDERNGDPDKMMTEWHGLKAGVREKERRVEAMKRNLEVVKRENDVFFERLRGWLGRHYGLRQGVLNEGEEAGEGGEGEK